MTSTTTSTSTKTGAKERWHFALHPDVERHSARNGFPSLGSTQRSVFHPTHAILVRHHNHNTTQNPNRNQQLNGPQRASSHPDPPSTSSSVPPSNSIPPSHQRAPVTDALSQNEQHEVLKTTPTQTLEWTSRDHRKNRHTMAHGQHTRHADSPLAKLAHLRRLEYWNISWWVAVAFTLGSIVWVVNGFYAFEPFINSHAAVNMTGVGWTGFVGATIFEFGSVFGMWEAWNRGGGVAFGEAVGEKLGVAGSVGGSQEGLVDGEKGVSDIEKGGVQTRNAEGRKRKWVWFSLETHYWRELGFLAAFVQMVGATIFWISGFTAIPQIYSAIEDNTPLLNGVYWSPQVVGGSCFIISPALLMLENSKVWYKPAVTTMGWHVGFWNCIGGIGFTLCGALGYAAASSSGVAYQSALSTFWGGWAFLLGSFIQWVESVNSV